MKVQREGRAWNKQQTTKDRSQLTKKWLQIRQKVTNKTEGPNERATSAHWVLKKPNPLNNLLP